MECSTWFRTLVLVLGGPGRAADHVGWIRARGSDIRRRTWPHVDLHNTLRWRPDLFRTGLAAILQCLLQHDLQRYDVRWVGKLRVLDVGIGLGYHIHNVRFPLVGWYRVVDDAGDSIGCRCWIVLDQCSIIRNVVKRLLGKYRSCRRARGWDLQKHTPRTTQVKVEF